MHTINQLTGHYPGRHDAARIWAWAGLPATGWRWLGQPHSSWQQALGDDSQIPLALLKQALFDHPSNAAYRAALPASGELGQQLNLVLRCCDASPTSDRAFRLGQWLPLESDRPSNEAFLAAVPVVHERWTTAERQALHLQLDRLTACDDDIAAPEDCADGAIALLAACEQCVAIDTSPPWRSDADALHRDLARLVTCELHLQRNEDDPQLRTNREAAMSEIQQRSPDFIARLDRQFAELGLPGLGRLLANAITRLCRAVDEVPDPMPKELLTGFREALWATVGSDHSNCWSASLSYGPGARP